MQHRTQESPHTKGKVLVAMSGGVDSSVAAAMLQRDGYDVVGCFMRLGSPGETIDDLSNNTAHETDACSAPGNSDRAPKTVTLPQPKLKIGHQGCCSILDASDARHVAAQLGIPLYICNFKKDFGRVIDYFVDEYASGRTPNPCVRCNDWLKFGKLHDYARELGADFIASGHYARIEHTPTGPQLRKGLDQSKDQSYVLFGVPREQLARMLLPIGAMEKSRVRALAKEWGLPVFDKPDSQEICFVPDNDYAALVQRIRPDSVRTGPIIDVSGSVVGEHQGQHKFTIGQRRGLQVATGKRVYVVEKDTTTNTVRIGSEQDLLRSACDVREANWLSPAHEELAKQGSLRALAKFRYLSPAAPASVRTTTEPNTAPAAPTPSGRTGGFRVEFDFPQVAVAPGQAIVLYDAADPDLVIGGGWIDHAEAPKA